MFSIQDRRSIICIR